MLETPRWTCAPAVAIVVLLAPPKPRRPTPMPKRLRDYDLNDFLHLRPLTQSIKTGRYRRVDRRYFVLKATDGDEQAVRDRLTGKRVLVTVAFGDPEMLAWHVDLVRRFVDTDEHLILDNSPEATAEIREIVAASGRCYLKLPPNPWTGSKPSRSHGLALNWAWQRILRPARPAAFGMLDVDMLPLGPSAPFRLLDGHEFGGDKRWSLDGQRWFLWAGYCFFRYDAVADKPLDFGLDWFIGLDTGGANWDVLYRHAAPASLPERKIEEVPALPGISDKLANFELRGEWLHEVGQAGDLSLKQAKREVLRAVIAKRLTAADGEVVDIGALVASSRGSA